MGGFTTGDTIYSTRTDSTEVFCPPGSTANISVESLPEALYGSSSAIITDSRILVCGGLPRSKTCNYIIPGSSDNWQPYGDLPVELWLAGMQVIKNEVYFLGGQSSAGRATDNVYRTRPDTASPRWARDGRMIQKRWGHCTAVWNNSVIIVTGK